ncbi:MAG TPA: transglycosylase SLT domain-containing protein [Candidatus Binataceae bacterium]|nr:transglycosylase SLT domain-containing protein [Candidatus Binataceae bacterium]
MKLRIAIAACFALALAAVPSATRAQLQSDSCAQFASGYNAYELHQLPEARRDLTAAAGCVRLADYALYYLALADRDSGDSAGAMQTLNRLAAGYPQSVMNPAGTVELARLEYQAGQYARVVPLARGLVDRAAPPQIEAEASYLLANSLGALGDYRSAYATLMDLRDKFPAGAFDARARIAAYDLLAAHPDLAETTSLDYREAEAALLLREGQAAAARDQINAALELSPQPEERVELLWMMVRSERGSGNAERAALLRYLAAAPGGVEAPAALDRLGHLAWRVDDTAGARAMFSRVAAEFPASFYAPESLYSMGRAFEDDRQFDSARGVYRRLLARYPDSAAAERARLRLPWTFYMARRYADAAREFAAMVPHADSISDRDMLTYWRARALEKSGNAAEADAIFRRLAMSTASNYYPSLASLRTGIRPAMLPAAMASDPSSRVVPAVDAPGAAFHLDRVLALRELGLRPLEPPELKALEPDTDEYPALRDFLLGELMAAGAWYDAIVIVTRFEKHGAIGPAVAERVRYPLAYPNLIIPTASRAGLNPWLVMALTRQESLFNPDAQSVSNARGLMQLLPSTAVKVAAAQGAAEPGNLFDPAVNVRLGVALMRKLMTLYGGDRFRAVAAYNGGEQAVARWNALFPGDDDAWVENIQYRETCDYVKKVIGGMREYELLYPSRGSAGGMQRASVR